MASSARDLSNPQELEQVFANYLNVSFSYIKYGAMEKKEPLSQTAFISFFIFLPTFKKSFFLTCRKTIDFSMFNKENSLRMMHS